MNPPVEPPQLSQEEQGRLLAKVYAFILSDQFTRVSTENNENLDEPSAKKHKARTKGERSKLVKEAVDSQEPKE